MNGAVFEPALFFISDEEWRDLEARDRFLAHLDGHLTAVAEYANTKVLWSDGLELCLWSSPQLPPWRSDRDWRNPLVQVLYAKFHGRCNFLSCDQTLRALVSPELTFVREDIADAFLIMVNEIALIGEPVCLCLGVAESAKRRRQYTFTSMPGLASVAGLPICDPSDWLQHVDIVAHCWPSNRADAPGLAKAIDFVRKRDFNGQALKNNFSFSTKFIADIIGETKHRRQILGSMVKRLLLTTPEAGRDGGLQDESLESGERRFRVSLATRIHYTFEAGNRIKFLKYYGEGEHDDGL